MKLTIVRIGLQLLFSEYRPLDVLPIISFETMMICDGFYRFYSIMMLLLRFNINFALS